ncbi:sodium-dependent transporter [Coraliomargarita akajimensis]|uniref:Sodium:neurotransmitter symporter n=1 Tax=Coraliomargarita akajimensis (strain DSM 45221 / IAM 15411 / JCM 23193 / KCTC 12865 / 04OKA010-24) TaxID=583355 RepID=D5ELU5_CORAD|nr:sodium-dependent transporter [Coraliomargarita akajimensis]ADE53270.1 sodium:neurotransmitter symporter [Coraliomargarita akajimensis DSM 45221]
MSKQTESWNSRLGVILAVSGSAVGLGNFLRFPGQVAEYGGGAFMLAYFIAFIFIGLPICWAEWAMGRQGGLNGFNSAPSILAAITKRPAMRYIGIIAVIIPVVIYMYYVVIEAWCLAYATNYLFGDMKFTEAEQATGFFVGLIGAEADGSALKFDLKHVGFYVLIVFILNFILIWRGLSKGIELFCRYAMPALVVIALVILVRVLTLGTPNPDFPDRNINNGLGFMWNPTKHVLEVKDADANWIVERELVDANNLAEAEALAASDDNRRVHHITIFEQLQKADLWLAAAGQIFFSLSVGFGVIITYSSYLSKKDDIVLSGLAATSANEFCEVAVGGLISIPAAVAFFGVSGLAGIGLGTFDIGFNALPMVFAQMPFGMVFGFLFFFLLFLAAVTSSLSMLQPGIAFLEESLQLNRRQSVAVLGFMVAVGAAYVLYFSAGVKGLDTIDFWVTNLLMVLLATAQVIIFAWVIGIDKGMELAHQGSAIRIPGFFKIIMKYVTPAFLLIILGRWFYSSVIGYRFSDEIEPSGYIKDLFIEPNTVAWLGVALVILTGVFILLNMLPGSHFSQSTKDTKGTQS